MPDIAAEFLAGVQSGAQIRHQQAALQQARVQAQMEADARADQQNQENLREEQRLRVQESMRQSEIGLQQQRLQEVQKENDARTRDAALRLADQQGFASDLSKGLPIEQALYRHPRLSTPQAAIAAHKDTLDLASQRLDLAQKRLAMDSDNKDRTAADREKAATDRANKIPMLSGIPTTRDSSGAPDATGPKVSLPFNSPAINEFMGTNAPAGSGTNFNPTLFGLPPGTGSVPQPHADGTVLRNKKDGKTYVVKGGVPVLMSDASAPADATSDDDQASQ